MIPLSDVAWGPVNATERDTKFQDKWIEPAEVRNCLEHDCWIVTGEKGSGKSAIQRAMREIHRDEYYATPLVDFDKVTFGLLYENLQNLSRTTQLDSSVTLSNYWQYSIVIELIRACVKKDPALYGDLLQEGRASRHGDMPLNKRLMYLFEESWNLVDDFTAARRSETSVTQANMVASGGLSSDLLHNLSTFPLGPEYEKVKREFFGRVERNQHRVTLILDGFDTLITQDTKASSIHVIFSSLVDAILSLRKNEHLSSFIGIKALIPHDRFINLSLRDSDKVGAMHTAIRWNHETLKEFVEKRIAITPKIRSGNFPSLWRQVFPETVPNAFYKLEEDSFQYVLRHTMFRPRQLQIHLAHLAHGHSSVNIDPSMVPKSISESSLELARYFIDEYRLDHPNLERLILTFERKPNVMEFKIFREMVATGIRRFHPSDDDVDVDERIDVLYAIGLFGVIRFVEQGDVEEQPYYPPTKESRRHYLDFFYRKPYSKVSSRLSDTSLVALHSIFVNFANLRLHDSLIVG
jgi:hypothetical protein